MLVPFFHRLDLGLRRLLPLGVVVAFIFLNTIPWPLPYFGPIVPSLGLIAVYYWSIHRPDLLRPSMVFACGLLYDYVHFLPFGMTALVYVGVHQLVLHQRRFFVGQAFHMLWAGFAVIVVLVQTAQWLIQSAYDGQWVKLMPVVLQGILTMAVFPLPAWLLIHLQRVALSRR